MIESPAEEGPAREVARYKEQVLDPLKATWEDNAVPCEEDDGDEAEGEESDDWRKIANNLRQLIIDFIFFYDSE